MIKRNKKRYLYFIFALSALLILFGVSTAYAANTYSWSGTWSSNFGTMWLTQSGNQLTGNYTWDGGTLTGTVSGNILSGTWYEPGQVGRFRFTMSDDGKSFTGTWGYGSSETGGSWNGTRVTPIAQDDTAAVDENSSVVVNVLANDISMGGENLFISSVSTPAHGTAVIEKSCTNPEVVTVNSSTHPAMPSGLKTVYATMPVLKWNNITYWGYSYIDNRVGMCIVAYDSAGNIVKQWERSGDRYLQTIYVDTAAKKVYFRGQYYAGGYNPTGIMMTFDELLVGVEKIKYTPNTNYHGNDSFTYTAKDSIGEASATVFITVIDKTPPVITIAPYNTNPTNQDIIVTASTNEGTLNAASHTFIQNGSFTFTATDAAGNSTSKTVTITNIDKVPPVITIAPYNINPTNQDIIVTASTNEGTLNATSHTFTQNGTFTFTAKDAAGNSTSQTVTITNIDKTPPTTTASLSGTIAWTGTWSTNFGTMWLTQSGNQVSGNYTWDGGTLTGTVSGNILRGTWYEPGQVGRFKFIISSDGKFFTGTWGYGSSETGGSWNGTRTSAIPEPNADGWNKAEVTVTLIATDEYSGVASTEYKLDNAGWTAYQSAVTISSEGVHTLLYRSTDNAGNQEDSKTLTIRIDKTPSTTTASVSPEPNINGWNKTDVTVTLSAADNLSGVASIEYKLDNAGWTAYQGAVTINSEGVHTLLYRSRDNAGNQEEPRSLNIRIDKTSPTLTGATTTASNGNGWYKDNVIVHFMASDSNSGLVSVTPDQVISSEGNNLSVTGSANDLAGNSAYYTVSGINIDKTSPVITAVPDPVPNSNGWNNSDVTVHFVATDSMSGIESMTPDVTLAEEGAGQIVGGEATDLAGNSAATSITLNIDKTAPTIVASKPEPNANGWYRADVTVSFTAADELSGLESVTDPITLAGEGADQSVTGVAVDRAGNPVSITVSGINIDKTKPTVVINSPTSALYYTDGSFTVDYTAADSISGIETETATLDGSEVTKGQVIPLAALAGDHTLTVTIKDVAGNGNTASTTFTVIITATVDIKPDTLNLKSSGSENSITGYIEFPSGYDVNLIDVASVRMIVNGTAITAQASPTSIGDYESDGVQDLMVKVDRQQMIAAIGAAGDITVRLSGCLTDGRKFAGTDVVKVIAPGNGKK